MKILRVPLVIILLVVAGRAFNAEAQTETNLYSFVSTPDGGIPLAPLVQGSDGNFYGTTWTAGTNGLSGTVFRISPSGTETGLYSFVGSPTDGSFPTAGLVQGSDGNFYGTTYYGGTNTGCGSFGCGTVFRISPSGTYTSLYSFVGSPGDGSNPEGGLVQASDGNFYGTTYYGGANGGGTVFQISTSGSYTSVYSFGSFPNDGYQPFAGLVQGSDSNLYGTTYYGGANGSGTVFRIRTNGSYTSVYSFGSVPNDGYYPAAGLAQGSDGNLYGTAYYGGANGSGTVFRISTSGSYTSFYSFVGSPTDGAEPKASLVQGSDGNFYGTTEFGGTNNDGTVFRISPSGSETNLHSFVSYPSDGLFPVAGLVQGSDGNFYGTTEAGGASMNCGNGCGTVFRISVPLNPPPNQISRIQKAGTNVVLSIPSIAGETYQLQFSSSMKPTNWVNVGSVSITNSIGALLTLTNFGGAVGPQGFYRFDITP